jgi:hypothetical protein
MLPVVARTETVGGARLQGAVGDLVGCFGVLCLPRRHQQPHPPQPYLCAGPFRFGCAGPESTASEEAEPRAPVRVEKSLRKNPVKPPRRGFVCFDIFRPFTPLLL